MSTAREYIPPSLSYAVAPGGSNRRWFAGWPQRCTVEKLAPVASVADEAHRDDFASFVMRRDESRRYFTSNMLHLLCVDIPLKLLTVLVLGGEECGRRIWSGRRRRRKKDELDWEKQSIPIGRRSQL